LFHILFNNILVKNHFLKSFKVIVHFLLKW
jgi:hypothetical protein